MLSLRTDSSPAWLAAALGDVGAVLVDHAHCEHKAAVTALAFVSRYPDDPVLVERLSHLAAEEAQHLHQVVTLCQARGLAVGHPQRDPYAKALLSHARSSELEHRVDRLLVCSLIEARSCERLKLLSESLAGLGEPDLARFYDELWRVEAGHHTLFVELAERSLVRRGTSPDDARRVVKARLDELADAEAAIVASLPARPAIH